MNKKSLSILIEKLKNLKKIRRLNIVGMKINDETVNVLKKFKTYSTKYESLALGDVAITPEILIDLLGSELFNKTKILTLKRVNIKSYQTHKLFNGIESMPKIEYVILDNCKVKQGMMKQIKEDLTLKYEIVYPEEASKEISWKTLLITFFVLSFMSNWMEKNDKSNNKNKKSNTTEILPNNNDTHQIQNHNQNSNDNYSNDENYLQNNNNNVTEEYNSTEEYSGGSTPHGFNR